MEMLLVVIVGWFLLAIPVGLVVGKLLSRQNRENGVIVSIVPAEQLSLEEHTEQPANLGYNNSL
jgi:hypothetical protein